MQLASGCMYNHVLRFRLRVAVKLYFRPYIRRYTSPNVNFEYSYPLILLLFLECINVWPYIAAVGTVFNSCDLYLNHCLILVQTRKMYQHDLKIVDGDVKY